MTITRQAVYFSILGQLAVSVIFGIVAMALLNKLVIIPALITLPMLIMFLWSYFDPDTLANNRFTTMVILLVSIINIIALFFATQPNDKIPDYAFVAAGILAADFVCILLVGTFAQPFKTPEKDKNHV